MTANIVLFYLIFQLAASENYKKAVLTGVFLSLGINAFLGVFQFITGGSTILNFGLNNEKGSFEKWGRFIRSSGFFQNTNLFVSFLIPLSLMVIPFLKKHSRWLLILPGAAIFFTFSRGAWIAIAGALLILILRKGKKYLPLLLPLLMVVFLSPFGARFFGNAPDRSVYYSDLGRRASFQVASEFIGRNFWTGIGPGRFYDEFAKYAPENLPWENFYPHNAYISSLGETGIAGLIALLSLFYLLLASAAKGVAPPGKKWIYASVFSLFLLSNFYDLHTEPQFWLIIALGASASEICRGGILSDSV